MDPLITYLIVVNVVTLLSFTIYFLLCIRRPRLDDTAANSFILDIFPIAGGAIGMLLALFVFTGLGRGRRMNKNNVAWWFLAIVCFVVWGFVAAAKLGLVSMDVGVAGILLGWDLERLKVLGTYLVVINLVTFVAFAWDKHVAMHGNDAKRRVSEARLLGLSLAGGSLGGLLAMRIFRHKTRKWYFAWGLPCLIVLGIAVILYAHLCGLV